MQLSCSISSIRPNALYHPNKFTFPFQNEFSFDKTFDASLTNQDLFTTSILPFLTAAEPRTPDFSCICFGQTGSGKTHTLFGARNQDGLCLLTAQALFARTDTLLCGFYEIYNGHLYDLLNANNRLVLRDDAHGHVNVVGLLEVEVRSLGQLRRIIEQAQASRHVGVTSFNKASSRSHAVVQLTVPCVAPVSGGQAKQAGVRSKVNSALVRETASRPLRVLFIDLAGSERGIDAQNNRSDNRKEGAEINQSLLAVSVPLVALV